MDCTPGEESFDLTLTPRTMEGQEGGKVGIVPELPTRSAGIGETITGSGTAMVDTTNIIFQGFRQLIQKFSMDDLGGPVRTFEVTGQIAKQGIEQLTYWAILSLYLGIFNLADSGTRWKPARILRNRSFKGQAS